MENNLTQTSKNFFKPLDSFGTTTKRNYSDFNLTERNSLNTTKKSSITSPEINKNSNQTQVTKQRRRSHLANPNGGIDDEMQAYLQQLNENQKFMETGDIESQQINEISKLKQENENNN